MPVQSLDLSASGASRASAFHRLAQVTTGGAFVLICAGGLVTSTGSALAVPDWPLSFGQFFPPMQGGVLFEHGHRMIAGVVGLLVVVLGFWIGARDSRAWVRGLAYAAMGAIVLQAFLGGATVLLKLPPVMSVSHACLAQGVLSLLVVLSVATSPEWIDNRRMETQGTSPTSRGAEPPASASVRRAGRFKVNAPVVTTVLIYIQLILGAIVRHTGLALVPHMIGAGLVAVAVFWSAVGILRQSSGVALSPVSRTSCPPEMSRVRPASRPAALRPLAWTSMGLVLVQVSLGLTLYFVGRFISVTTVHVAVGALLLMTFVVLSLKTAFPGATTGGQAANGIQGRS
ncbi:MAG: COX15/CtaA family protein [Nitrospirae bacterium]|nr:COX15/CtaA family protein [Nitrospirota bacterium]